MEYNMKMEIKLIDSWDNGVPRFKNVEIALGDPVDGVDDSIFKKYQFYGGVSPCGNIHANKGSIRVIENDVNHYFESSEILDEFVTNRLPTLGETILVSAGHFMPIKGDINVVNSNSYASLVHGLEIIKSLLSANKKADLLITINDVTIGNGHDQSNISPSFNSNERHEYYSNFNLPYLYKKSIISFMEENNIPLNIYIFGENKLSERLGKEAPFLLQNNFLTLHAQHHAYCLPNFINLKSIIETAHDKNSFHYEVFISNQEGVSGRPKCVRACAKLAALPHELKYSGFVQILPVCSRNALEGFLIGKQIYDKKFNSKFPYLSIHNIFSCF